MFIEQAHKSLSEPWRYILGIFVVFMGWQLIGGIPLIAALVMKSDSLSVLAGGDMGAMAEVLGTNYFLFLMLLTFVIGILCLFFWTKVILKQLYFRNLFSWEFIFSKSEMLFRSEVTAHGAHEADDQEDRADQNMEAMEAGRHEEG